MKIKQPDELLKIHTWYDRDAETNVVREDHAIDAAYKFADQFIPEWIPIDWEKLPSGDVLCAIIKNGKVQNIFIDDIKHSIEYFETLNYTHYFPINKIQMSENGNQRVRAQST